MSSVAAKTVSLTEQRAGQDSPRSRPGHSRTKSDVTRTPDKGGSYAVEGPSRGLLPDCENRWIVCSSIYILLYVMFRRSGVSVQVPAAPSAETVAGGGEAERARERQHERRLRRRGTLSNR